MIIKFLHFLFFFLFVGLGLQAQVISSLVYSGKIVIAHSYEVNGNIVGGLSGIIFNSNDNLFYLVADKPPARMFKANIYNDVNPKIKFLKALKLRPGMLSESELEGIAHNYQTGNFYVSDEQKNGTRIIELDYEAKFIRIVEPINQSFMSLSSYNSGIEGLTISNNLKYLLYAFERPTSECQEQSLVRISKMSLTEPASHEIFYYELHLVANDKINTNGISDILFLSESRLLVMERAFIPGEGNVVRLYEAILDGRGHPNNEVNCNNDSITPLESKLLFDFGDVSQFKIDNAEGMTFNTDKSVLYIVTDNNFNKKQETQIIALDVIWK
jgi:uncharacterized protein YjiK